MTNNKRPTQCERVLAYLKRHGSITDDDARAMTPRIKRVASRINELREQGCPIRTERVTYKDNDGMTVSYARYHMEPANDLFELSACAGYVDHVP